MSILILHRVFAAPDELQPDGMDARHFDALCGWMKDWFQVLPLDEAVRRLRSGTLPARAAAITFDDGYADNHDVAMPILQRHGLTAAFFIATGFLGGGRMFNDTVAEVLRRASCASLDLRDSVLGDLGQHDLSSIEGRRTALRSVLQVIRHWQAADRNAFCAELQHKTRVDRLPADLMLDHEQVRNMHKAGMLIGSHTVNHPMLARLEAPQALSELLDSRRTLEGLISAPVTMFAYPNGRPDEDYSARTVELVREAGFEAALSTAWGTAHQGSDFFQLPRFTPWDRSRMRFGARMLANLLRGPERRATPA